MCRSEGSRAVRSGIEAEAARPYRYRGVEAASVTEVIRSVGMSYK